MYIKRKKEREKKTTTTRHCVENESYTWSVSNIYEVYRK